jgi:hypothetical protein
LRQDEKVYLFVMAVIVVGMISCFVGTELVDESQRTLLFSDNGFIKKASVIGYLAVLMVILAQGGWGYLKSHAYIFILVTGLGLGEMHFDTKFTGMSIFGRKFYLTPEVPFSVKIFGFLIIVIILICIILLVKKHLRSFMADCLKEIVPMSAGISLLFLIMSKSIDDLAWKLHKLGINISHQMSASAESIEEIIELGIPLMLLISTIAFFNSTKKST